MTKEQLAQLLHAAILQHNEQVHPNDAPYYGPFHDDGDLHDVLVDGHLDLVLIAEILIKEGVVK